MTTFHAPIAHSAGRAVVHLPSRSRTATHDPRWPAIAAALARLRNDKRRAVRIIDADCGAGCLLLEAMRHARALGFTAIEGRGIDASPALIGRARAAAARLRDPAIGIVFEVADLIEALDEEHYCPADIILWHGVANGEASIALARAGKRVIGSDMTHRLRGIAA